MSGDQVYALAVGLDGSIFAGGTYSVAGGVANTAYLARWDGSAWNSVGGTAPKPMSEVYALKTDNKGLLYAGGGLATNYIGIWDGSRWQTLGSGVNATVFSLAIGSDFTLYAGGNFTTANGITLADRVARWNGYAWAHLDVDLPGTPIAYALLASSYADPVIPQKYDLFIGFTTTGTGNFAGKTTLDNEGSIIAFPRIIINRSGGDSAILETLRNEDTGKELLFNYSLLSGETLTIDLAPTQRTIVSSFFGPRPDAILANSDFGTWALLPDSNNITSFIATSGSPTVTAWMIWREAFNSY